MSSLNVKFHSGISLIRVTWGGMKIAPLANPFDGIANLTLVSKVGRFELLRFFRRVFSGSHMSHPKVEGLEGKHIVLETAGLGLWADGEFMVNPCDY